MILYMLYLIGFVVFTINLVIICVIWIASLNSTIIFFILNILKFWLISYLHLGGCCLKYVNIFYEDYV